jgi:1,4-dihydroxy-6-naphthoate synthase
VKHITLGHTPDADDAFMFFAIATGKVTSPLFAIEHVIEDIETLNRRAIVHELDVTAISAHAYAYVEDYLILRSGASFGLNYGPLVLSRRPMQISELKDSLIAIPGNMTSANLLLKLLIGNFRSKVMEFSSIPQALSSGSVDAGLIIHEAQISSISKFHTVVDLGKWWHKITSGLAVPLGINVASRRSMTLEEIREFDSVFRKSIDYALNHEEDAVNYSMEYARGTPKELMERFVKMYVNKLTVDMGSEGKKSIELLLKKGREQNILTCFKILFSDINEDIKMA